MHGFEHSGSRFSGDVSTDRWLRRSRLADFLFTSQPEQLIGLGRLLFSGLAFLAIYLDPTQPARDFEETYYVLFAYLIYSAALAATSFRRPLGDLAQYVTHSIDIVILSVLVHYSDGATSPFFAFFTFALLTATMRWGWRGTLGTAVILELLLLIVSWPDLEFSLAQDSELNRLIMRGADLLVAAAMLGYFGAYRERSRERLAMLASWPFERVTEEDNPPLADSLGHAAEVLGAVRVLVIWQDHEESVGRVAYWDGTSCKFAEVSSLDPAVAAAPKQATFKPVESDGNDLLQATIQLLPLSFFAADTTSGIASSFCAAPFRSLHYSGTVFVLDPRYQSEDILSLAEIVAARIASELERFAMTGELAASAIARERVRLARDMHDGVLQDLTAASLQLKAAAAHLPDGMTQPLKEVSWLLLSQQRRIRAFVESVRPKVAIKQHVALGDQLQSFAKTLGRQWQRVLTMTVEPPDLQVDTGISTAVFQLISEATANAVRHGNAEQIGIEVIHVDKKLYLRVLNDGRSAAEFEPHSLRERVAELGGRLSLASSSRGTELSIELPL